MEALCVSIESVNQALIKAVAPESPSVIAQNASGYWSIRLV
jgi:hypothetical protein